VYLLEVFVGDRRGLAWKPQNSRSLDTWRMIYIIDLGGITFLLTCRYQVANNRLLTTGGLSILGWRTMLQFWILEQWTSVLTVGNPCSNKEEDYWDDYLHQIVGSQHPHVLISSYFPILLLLANTWPPCSCEVSNMEMMPTTDSLLLHCHTQSIENRPCPPKSPRGYLAQTGAPDIRIMDKHY
jgi:hypothetical protein